jgi:hypothetical protein
MASIQEYEWNIAFQDLISGINCLANISSRPNQGLTDKSPRCLAGGKLRCARREPRQSFLGEDERCHGCDTRIGTL